jgi:hypothetical protein
VFHAGLPEKLCSDKVDIAANGTNKAQSDSEGKLAPATPESAPQGATFNGFAEYV